jgi:hypothetical protein
MNFTSFYQILKFPGLKIKCRDFLYWGLFDPKPLTSWPEGPRWQATLDQVNLVSGLGKATSARLLASWPADGDDGAHAREHGRQRTRGAAPP